MALAKHEPEATRFLTPLRIASTVIVLGLIAAFGVSSCNSNDPAPAAISKPPASGVAAVRPPLPAVVLDSEMKSAHGDPIKLSDYSGKVLLINLWATWCGPCRRETPELVKLYKEYHDRGFEIVGLSTEDPTASEQSVREFVRAYNVDYRVGWATREVAVTLMAGRGSIPQNFVITRDGRVAKRSAGFHPLNTPRELREAIEEALSDTASSR